MKQVLYLSLILSFCFPVFSRPEKKPHGSEFQSCKKQGTPKYQTYNQLTVVSVDHDKNLSEMLSQLKRRYPRKYNLKYNLDKLEQDDFGYAPEHKKAYKI